MRPAAVSVHYEQHDAHVDVRLSAATARRWAENKLTEEERIALIRAAVRVERA